MPFQTSTSRSAGHSAARLASSCWLLKLSPSPASCLLANAVMLFCVDRKRFHFCFSLAAGCGHGIHHSGRRNKQVDSAACRKNLRREVGAELPRSSRQRGACRALIDRARRRSPIGHFSERVPGRALRRNSACETEPTKRGSSGPGAPTLKRKGMTANLVKVLMKLLEDMPLARQQPRPVHASRLQRCTRRLEALKSVPYFPDSS